MNPIEQQARFFRQQLTMAARAIGRDDAGISLVAVSKMHPADSVVAAIIGGIRDIGENRVQEAEAKRPAVEQMLRARGIESASVKWHLVGRLQSNKAARAARLFDVIHSMDNIRIAQLLSKAAGEVGKVLDIFIEVNTSGELSKAGVAPEQVRELAEETARAPHLRLVGLMTIGPLTDEPGLIRESFDLLRRLRDELLNHLGAKFGGGLSMGMSGDWKIALAAGATTIRVGTAIFGKREA